MFIRSVHHVQISIPTGSDAEARAFYCDFLGLREIPKPPNLAARGGFWMQLDHLQIHAGVEDGIDRERTRAHVAYAVDDLALARDRLAARGIASIEGAPIPGFARFECRDPFGNRMEFIQAVPNPGT